MHRNLVYYVNNKVNKYSACPFPGKVEAELLHTYSAVLRNDNLLLIVRLAVLMAVILTVPVVIFPVSNFI